MATYHIRNTDPDFPYRAPARPLRDWPLAPPAFPPFVVLPSLTKPERQRVLALAPSSSSPMLPDSHHEIASKILDQMRRVNDEHYQFVLTGL